MNETPPKHLYANPLMENVSIGGWHETTANRCRCMAAYLKSYGFAPASKIVDPVKERAHWMFSDLAIMMADFTAAWCFSLTDLGDILGYKLIMANKGADACR